MENTPDESRLKELVKSAVKEALDEHGDFAHSRPKMFAKAGEQTGQHNTVKVILIWVAILITAVGIYNLVEVSR
jgi:hypothetical protein